MVESSKPICNFIFNFAKESPNKFFFKDNEQKYSKALNTSVGKIGSVCPPHCLLASLRDSLGANQSRLPASCVSSRYNLHNKLESSTLQQ